MNGKNLERVLRWLALAVVAGLPAVVAWSLPLRDLYLTGGDEGIELSKALFFARTGGWPVEVWNDQPLTHTRLYAWMLGHWSGPIGPRWWSLGTCVLLLASVYGFTYHQRPDRWVALASVVVVALSPLVLDLSVSAMQEMPSTAFGMASVYLVTRDDFSRDRRVQGLAVLAAVAGLSIKLTAGIYAFAGFLMLVRRHRAMAGTTVSQRGWWAFPPLGYAAGVASGVALALWWLDGRPLDCLLGSHWASWRAARASVGPEGEGPWSHLIRLHPFFVGFALWGGIVALGARHGADKVGGDTVVLLGVVGLFNAGIRPWWEYYALSCWLALAPLAAIGWVAALRSRRLGRAAESGMKWRGVMAGCARGAAVVAGCYWAWSWAQGVANFHTSPKASTSRILDVVRRQCVGVEGGTLYSVDPILAFWLGLRVPESLLVVTQKRFLSGDLDPAAVPSEVRRSRCDLVIIPQGLDLEQLPDWPVLLREDYVLVALAEGREIYVHRQWKPTPFDTRIRW